jgi:hypothetical protein
VRALSLLVIAAGCGRLGFGDAPEVAIDAPEVAVDAAPDAHALVDEAVARYPMDDDPATGVIGSVQLPTTCTACPTAAAGHRGGGYRFGGAAAFELPSSTLLGGPQFTVALWFTARSIPGVAGGASMVNKTTDDTVATNPTNILLYNGGNVTFESTAGANDYLQALTPVGTDAWHHVAATWDGTTKRIYLDGVLSNAIAATIVDSPRTIWVGADRDFGVPMFYFDGTLDELQFYDRPLTPAEIALLASQ